MSNAHIKITTESGAFSLDTDIDTEDAARLVQYALQMIDNRNARKTFSSPPTIDHVWDKARVEDKIARDVQNIKGGRR